MRRPGAGRPAAFSPETTRVARDHLNDLAVHGVHIGPRQVKAEFARQPRTAAWQQTGAVFKFSTSWARAWLNANKHLLLQPVSLAKKDIGQARTTASLTDYLTKIYQWRLKFLLAHGGAAALHLDLAVTACRILSADEISLFLSPDTKDAFTVLLCTNAAGHVYLILVIFDGQRNSKIRWSMSRVSLFWLFLMTLTGITPLRTGLFWKC